jgi:DNA-binding beta-propeller fold protein YncE
MRIGSAAHKIDAEVVMSKTPPGRAGSRRRLASPHAGAPASPSRAARALPPKRLRGSFAVVAVLAVVSSMLSTAAASRSGADPHSGLTPVLAVGNSYDGTVDFIDAETLRRLGPPLNVLPDGRTPRDPKQAAVYPLIIAHQGEYNYTQEVEFAPDGRTLYVSRGYLGDIAAFSVTTRRLLWRVQLLDLRADHLAVSPDGRDLFASSLPGDSIYEISTRTHQTVASYTAGTWPHVIEFSPNGRYVYSGSLGNQLVPYGQYQGLHQIVVVNARTLRRVRTYSFDAGIRPFAFSSDGRELVVQLSYFNGFKVVNLKTGRIIRTVSLPLRGPARHLAPQDYPNEAAHHGIAVSGGTVCDAGTISNYAALVSLTTGRVRKIINVGESPGEALTSLDGKYCFVTNRGPTGLNPARVPVAAGDSVSAIDYQTGAVRTIAVGRHPQAETTALIPTAALRAGGFLR